MLAVTTRNLLPTQAVSLPTAPTLRAAFPDDSNWNAGSGDGYNYVQYAKAAYDQGTGPYNADINAAIADANDNRQAANSAGDNNGYMYWSDYWTALRIYRDK